MIYAFDLYLLRYDTNVTRPVGYDFAEFSHFPTNDELYDTIINKYSSIKNPGKVYLFNIGDICVGLGFYTKTSDNRFRLIANNVRSIGKVKEPNKYLSTVKL